MIDKFDEMIFFEYVSGEDIDDYVTEEANLEALSAYNAFKKEFKPCLKKMKKAMKAKNYDRAMKYHKESVKLLEDLKNEIAELDEKSGISTMMLGQILHNLSTCAKVYGVYAASAGAICGITALATPGMTISAAALAGLSLAALPVYLYAIFKSIQIIVRICENIEDEKMGVKSRDFNTLRGAILSRIKKFEKVLKENEKMIKSAKKGDKD